MVCIVRLQFIRLYNAVNLLLNLHDNLTTIIIRHLKNECYITKVSWR